MHTAVLDGEGRRAAHAGLRSVLQIADQGLAFCRAARSVRTEDFTGGTDDVQLVETQRLSELRDAHADRQAPLIEIARFEPCQRAVDQWIVSAQGLAQQRQALEFVRELTTEWFQRLRELISEALLLTAVPRLAHTEAERDDRDQAERTDGEQQTLSEGHAGLAPGNLADWGKALGSAGFGFSGGSSRTALANAGQVLGLARHALERRARDQRAEAPALALALTEPARVRFTACRALARVDFARHREPQASTDARDVRGRHITNRFEPRRRVRAGCTSPLHRDRPQQRWVVNELQTPTSGEQVGGGEPRSRALGMEKTVPSWNRFRILRGVGQNHTAYAFWCWHIDAR